MIIKDKIRAIAITFTALTITSSIYYLIIGETYDTHFHIIMRFLISAIAIASLIIFEQLKGKPLYIISLLHYGVTMAAVFALVWLTGIFVELHTDAYRDIFLNYTIIYMGFSGSISLILRVRKTKLKNNQ